MDAHAVGGHQFVEVLHVVVDNRSVEADRHAPFLVDLRHDADVAVENAAVVIVAYLQHFVALGKIRAARADFFYSRRMSSRWSAAVRLCVPSGPLCMGESTWISATGSNP